MTAKFNIGKTCQYFRDVSFIEGKKHITVYKSFSLLWLLVGKYTNWTVS